MHSRLSLEITPHGMLNRFIVRGMLNFYAKYPYLCNVFLPDTI